MRIGFAAPLIIFVLLFVGLGLGLLALQPALSLPYICAAPWIGVWLGRASLSKKK